MPKTPLNIFYFARWTFPKAHKIFQGYLKLYSNYMNIIQIQIANDLNSKSQNKSLKMFNILVGTRTLAKNYQTFKKNILEQ